MVDIIIASTLFVFVCGMGSHVAMYILNERTPFHAGIISGLTWSTCFIGATIYFARSIIGAL